MTRADGSAAWRSVFVGCAALLSAWGAWLALSCATREDAVPAPAEPETAARTPLPAEAGAREPVEALAADAGNPVAEADDGGTQPGPTWAAPAGEAAPVGANADAKEPEKWSPPRFAERRVEREEMVRVIRSYGLADADVLDAMLAVPRHEFVPEHLSRAAYDDTPLPIGHGQTISQPYIVAEMTRLLDLEPDSRVLEIGTGSGYQAAVLTEFTRHVYSIEVVKPLAASAKERLSRLGYGVVRLREADGYYGWPEEAPFDAIIVTCAATQIPPPLLQQLRSGGRMIIPVGGRLSTQWLTLVEKDGDGKVRSRALMAVRFVPFVRRPEPAG